MKTLILTPNKNEMCGMYQLAKDLSDEFDGEILTKYDFIYWDRKKVITLLYPMHKYGKELQKRGAKWICYDQKVPPPTKLYFPNFFRRMYMKWFCFVNERSKKGADEYWDVTKRKQKPRWTKLHKDHGKHMAEGFAIYVGRTTDYKNYEWLKKTFDGLDILLCHPENESDDTFHLSLSNASLLVTVSLWEGYGRSVMEAEALGIPAVAYDVGTHKKHIKKGICVPVGNKILFKKAIKEIWYK